MPRRLTKARITPIINIHLPVPVIHRPGIRGAVEVLAHVVHQGVDVVHSAVIIRIRLGGAGGEVVGPDEGVDFVEAAVVVVFLQDGGHGVVWGRVAACRCGCAVRGGVGRRRGGDGLDYGRGRGFRLLLLLLLVLVLDMSIAFVFDYWFVVRDRLWRCILCVVDVLFEMEIRVGREWERGRGVLPWPKSDCGDLDVDDLLWKRHSDGDREVADKEQKQCK